MSNKQAWVTLATNDTYSLGALVLAHSLKNVSTKYDLVILITSNVTQPMRAALQGVFNEVKEVNLLDSGDAENLQLLARPELGVTFTKLHCWRLTQYEKCVFLDADTLVLQNCDDLFEREELSAAPDVGWPDCFNSGVFVFKPSEETYKSLIDFALANGSFDGGDQGLLNMYFPSWSTADSSKRLPFLYNLSSAAIYSYLPAFKWYGQGVKIIHFIANSKPWLQSFDPVSRTVSTDSGNAHLTNFLQYWWNLFCTVVHPLLSPEMGGVAQSLSQMKIEEPTPEQLAQADLNRRQNWEQGNIDYMGRDSFDNIWSKISQTISKQTEEQPPKAIAPADALTELSTESEACSLQPAVEKPTPAVVDEPVACPLPVVEQPKTAPEPVVTVSEPTAPVTSEPIPVTVAAPEPVPTPVTEAVTSATSPEPVPTPALVPDLTPAPTSVAESEPVPVLPTEPKSSPAPASAPITATETVQPSPAEEISSTVTSSAPTEAPSGEK